RPRGKYLPKSDDAPLVVSSRSIHRGCGLRHGPVNRRSSTAPCSRVRSQRAEIRRQKPSEHASNSVLISAFYSRTLAPLDRGAFGRLASSVYPFFKSFQSK